MCESNPFLSHITEELCCTYALSFSPYLIALYRIILVNIQICYKSFCL